MENDKAEPAEMSIDTKLRTGSLVISEIFGTGAAAWVAPALWSEISAKVNA